MNHQALEHELRQWVGRENLREDVVTNRLVDSYRATLGPWLAQVPNGNAPLGIHWCLAPPSTPTPDLTEDGHEPRGDFLPPVPFARRMWAGGAVELHSSLPIGASIQRRSRIDDIALKRGRTGLLCFVMLVHEYFSEGQVAIRERQDIVYRDEGSAPASSPQKLSSFKAFKNIPVSAGLLFRYSALTFNSHRIHYDVDYARDVEGYAGLVVQGPLQATLLFNLAAAIKSVIPRSFHYRSVRAAIANGALQLCGEASASDSLACWVADADGDVTMTASATFYESTQSF